MSGVGDASRGHVDAWVKPHPLAFPWRTRSSVQLGPRERQMLELVWSKGNVTVRELLVDGKLRQAYTTIMTTLDRLFKKGLLDRTTDGKAFRYSSRCSPEDLPRLFALKDLQRCFSSTRKSFVPQLSYFVEAISAHDARLLDELWDLVERKRQELEAQDAHWLYF